MRLSAYSRLYAVMEVDTTLCSVLVHGLGTISVLLVWSGYCAFGLCQSFSFFSLHPIRSHLFRFIITYLICLLNIDARPPRQLPPHLTPRCPSPRTAPINTYLLCLLNIDARPPRELPSHLTPRCSSSEHVILARSLTTLTTGIASQM